MSTSTHPRSQAESGNQGYSSFLLALFIALSCTALLPAAPPTVTYLFPAGAQRGQTVDVTAAGTFERWPVSAWVDRPGVTVQADKTKGKLSVQVSPEAVPGVYWLRLHDDEGASTPRPFLVGTLPEIIEQDPNDDYRKPHVLQTAALVINGRLNPAGDVDCFAVPLKKGETLVAALEANFNLGSPLDGVLQVLSADGFVLEDNNDFRELDPQLTFTAPAAGRYIVRVFAFPAVPNSAIRFAGGEDYVYRLTLTTTGFADHALPLAVPRDQPGQIELVGWNIPASARKVIVVPQDDDTAIAFHPQVAQSVNIRLEPHLATVKAPANDSQAPMSITLPMTVSSRLAAPGAVDMYEFAATKGQRLFFQVESRSLGYPLDGVLRVLDSEGKVLGQNDDSGPARTGPRDPQLAFVAPLDGRYRVEVRDLHGDGGLSYVYRLRALLPQPDFELTVAAPNFTLTPGKPLSIPVTVNRKDGFKLPIDLTIEGLPAGVNLAPAASAPTGATAKTVMLQLSADSGPVAAPIRIIGKVAGEELATRIARANLTGLNTATPHLWLSVTKPAAP
ncbi:MAG: PPC domain-containing protein [Gemmataceae bacterium]